MKMNKISKSQFSSLLNQYRNDYGITQNRLWEYFTKSWGFTFSFRTYQNYESGHTMPKQEIAEKMLDALSQFPAVPPFQEQEKSNDPILKAFYENKELSSILNCLVRTAEEAVLSGMNAILSSLHKPWSQPPRLNFDAPKAYYDLPTKEDIAASFAIFNFLQNCAHTDSHVLSSGFVLIDEEIGVYPIRNKKGTFCEKLICFSDPVDGTMFLSGHTKGAPPRLFLGSSVLTFFHLDVGVLACAIGDLIRRTVVTRRKYNSSLGYEFRYSHDPSLLIEPKAFQLEKKSILHFRPAKNQSLQGISINTFCARPGRFLYNAKYLKPLLNEQMVKEIFSIPGSLGISYVALGLYDAAIEVPKGYKYWDFLPGAFIAEGAGCFVGDLQGEPIDLDAVIDQEHLLRVIRRGRHYPKKQDFDEKVRTRFVISGNRDLGLLIAQQLASSKPTE